VWRVADGTVIVLPSTDDRHASLLDEFLLGCPSARVIIVDPSGAGSRSARMSVAISELAPVPPLTVVAFGAGAHVLPQIAVAQRAAHRRVAEYVLVDPDLPPVNDTWPDAPVTVICAPTSEASLQGRLRGWTVLPTAALLDWSPDGGGGKARAPHF
jgi:hypothetical protein